MPTKKPQEPKVLDLVKEVEVLWAKRTVKGTAYLVKVLLMYKGDRYVMTFYTQSGKIVRGEKFRNGVAFTESGQSVWVPTGVYGAMYRKAAAVLNEKPLDSAQDSPKKKQEVPQSGQQELLPLRP